MHNLGSVFKQVINSFYDINNFSAFSASKNLQNSSIILKISETLSLEIIWKSFCIICNCLIITYKGAKIIEITKFSKGYFYPELGY